ncbi:MAG: hypothetical protein ACXU89_21820, partial [Xanthobacteraceae bacterium]
MMRGTALLQCSDELLQCSKRVLGWVSNPMRRTPVKKTYLSIAAAATISMAAGGTAGFAAELPTYEAAGLPISAVQLQVLGAANVREQALVPTSAASPHQPSVLTPRTKLTTATAASTRTETARS